MGVGERAITEQFVRTRPEMLALGAGKQSSLLRALHRKHGDRQRSVAARRPATFPGVLAPLAAQVAWVCQNWAGLNAR